MRPYADFAARLLATGIISDPWLDGAPRFEEEPVVLTVDQADALAAAAEDVAAAIDALCRLVAAEPALLDRLGLTPVQRLLWHASAPSWHALARVDAFFTDDGVAICEVNCDTPSGEAEAVLLGQLAARPDRDDPSRALLPRLAALVDALAGRARPSVGILYPTEITEDLSMVRLYAELFAARGSAVALGSPYNLGRAADGRLTVLGTPVDVIVRHYKTDWLGEREPVWLDEEPPPDAAPLSGPVALLAGAVLDGKLAMVNPLGAVVPQNKRALALLWELIDRLPTDAALAVRRHVPFTARLETVEVAALDRADWVLKSDYGCEGDEVIVGAEVDDATWAEALAQARPQRFVLQRRFDPRPGRARVVNHGVYLVGGRASGILTRLSDGPTDVSARTVATLVEAEAHG
jgi:glutathionylspermidine synthase